MVKRTASFPVELRRYAGLLWHWAWLLILMTVVASGTAYWQTRKAIPMYKAYTRLLVVEAYPNRSIDYSSLMTSERLAKTYTEMMLARPILEETISRLNLDMEPARLAKVVTIKLVEETNLVDVWLVDASPDRAALMLNTLVNVFVEQNQKLQSDRYTASKTNLQTQMDQIEALISDTNNLIAGLGNTSEDKTERDRLESNLAQYNLTYSYLLQSFEQVRIAETQSTSTISQIESALPPSSPVPSRVLQNTLLAGIIGLVLAGGIVMLFELSDDTIHDPQDVERVSGLPILGVINRHSVEEGSPIVAANPRSRDAEAFRMLRTNVQFASVDRPLVSLLITSPSPGDGKTTIASNLAISLAQGEQRVILIDGDLRRPTVHKQFAMANQAGLSDLFVRREISLNGEAQKSATENLSIIPSGKLPPNPTELLGSERMVKILNLLSKESDTIVIDSAPIMAVADSAVLASRVDGVIIVVRPGKTKQVWLHECVDQLERVGARVLGVVINNVKPSRSRYGYNYYYYRGYYSHYYDKESGASKNNRKRLTKQKEAKVEE